jgi:class 3 adenylate cyclase
VTFLFTDIESSTDLVRQLGAGFGRLRSEHRRVLREAFARHEGHEIDTAGDGFFVVFERAGDAVTAAVEGQRALNGGLGQPPLRVRMGLHSAEPYLDEDGYVGVGVNRAARICAAAHGGQVVISNATAGIIEDLGLDGLELLDLGEHTLKDLERPQHLFQLVGDGLPAEFPPLKTLEGIRSGPAIVTLLNGDLFGWRRVLRTLGDEQAGLIARAYHELVIDAIRADGGRELEIIADNFLAAFERPRDALRAAPKIRERLRTEPWFPEDDRPTVCIAIHSGVLADPTSRHLGSVAYHCVSLCNSAEPDQILVSHATEALLVGEPDVRLHDLGERVLEKDGSPVRVFELEG